MVQRLGARKHCNVDVKWLWLRQALDERWSVLCSSQERKSRGTLIPDRDVEHEKRNCQRGSGSPETIDGVRHESNRSSVVEGVAGHELMIIDPMKW